MRSIALMEEIAAEWKQIFSIVKGFVNIITKKSVNVDVNLMF